MTYPSGRKLTYLHDGQGRITQVGVEFNGVSSVLVDVVKYRPFASFTSYVSPSGTTLTRSFDQDGRVSAFTLAGAQVNLSYDQASRITSIGAQSYDYDARDRLISAGAETFTYDSNGNRLTRAAETFSYAPTSNRLTQAGTRVPQYDANGNLVSDGTRTFTYDARGRLVKIEIGNVTAQYAIDVLGRRAAKTVTRVAP
jgi:YD repeat-containing protein